MAVGLVATLLTPIKIIQNREESEVHSAKFSPDNEYLVSALGNGNVSVWWMVVVGVFLLILSTIMLAL